VLPLFFQNVIHFDATTTGLALLPGALATALSMPIAGRLAGRLDARLSVALGLGVFAVGAWQMGGLNAFAGYWDVFWPRALQGLALGFIFVPLTTATLANVPNAKMSGATGLYTLLRQLGGSLGIAVLQFFETRREDAAYSALASGVTNTNPAVRSFLHGAANASQSLQALAGAVAQNAMVIAYDDVFRLCGIIFALSIPTVFLMSGRRSSAIAPAE
jgi:DHA2 family multidrug resistance protein